VKHTLQTLVIAFVLTIGLFLGTATPSRAQIIDGYLPMPDLVIGTTSMYQNTATGQWCLAIQVKNNGDAASGACTLQMLRHTGQFSTLFNGAVVEACIIQRVAVPGIARGGSTTVYFNYTTRPTGQWGELWVDCYNNVCEVHPQRPFAEQNNGKDVYF
jgi:hypothetical protein